MERQIHRITHPFILVRAFITFIWIGISTVVYSCVCLVLNLFSSKAAYGIGKLWSQQILTVSGVKVKASGRENLEAHKKYTLICNHQSYMDIVALISSTPLRLSFVAKKELFRQPFFGWAIKALGHIPLDRSSARKARDSFTLAASRLRREDISLVLFPEGTRSPDGKTGEFKQGSFTLVIQAGQTVIPVAIQGSRNVLPKHSLLIRPGTIKIIYGSPIDIRPFKMTEKDKISRQVRQAIIDMIQIEELRTTS